MKAKDTLYREIKEVEYEDLRRVNKYFVKIESGLNSMRQSKY